MKHSILKGIAIASVAMTIGSCSHETPVSVQSNESQVAFGSPNTVQLTIANDTVTGKMLYIAGNLQNTWTNLYYRNQTSGSSWGSWVTNGSVNTGAVVTCNSGLGGQKRLYLFNIGTNYHVFYNIATTSTLPNSGWTDLGATPDGGSVVCIKVAKQGSASNSQMVVFVSTTGNHIYFKGTNSSGYFSTSSSTWYSLKDLGCGNFDVCTKNNGQIFVAWQRPSTRIVLSALVSSGNFSSSAIVTDNNFTSKDGYDIAVGKNLDGRMEIFATSQSNGLIYHNYETGVNANLWSSFISYFGPSGRTLYPKSNHLATGTNADGRLELFYQDFNSGYLYHTYQGVANGSWTDESVLTNAFVPKEISVAKGPDNKLYVGYYMGTSYYYIAQTAPNSGWAAPVSLLDF